MSTSKEAQLNLLISKRQQKFRKLQIIYDLTKAIISDKGKDTSNLNAFKVRYDQLEETQLEYQDLTERINVLQIEIDPKAKVDFQEISAFEELYYEVKAFNLQYFPIPAGSNNSCDKPAQPRLPKIDLPSFDGSLKNWTVFYDKFKSLIHDNQSINSVEKFHYLLSSVSGPALSIVRSLPLTEQNYGIVWESLTNKYQNKRILGSDLLETLISFKPFFKESISSFNEFLSIFKDSVTALKALEIDNLTEFILTHLALRTLPLETRKQFELQYSSSELPSFDNISDFIQKQVNALEVSKSFDSCSPHKSDRVSDRIPIRKSTNFSKRAFTATTATKCPVCKQEHRIYSCSEYLKMSPTLRKKTIRDLRHCFNCLKDHMIDSCKSKVVCSVCSSKHHSSLHGSFHISSPPTTDQSFAAPTSTSSDASNVHHSVSPWKTVLLGTALVHIQTMQGNYVPVRALIDGAQTSFITSACIQRLGLSVRKCNLPIAGLGQSFVSNIKGMTSCTLKPRHCDHPLLKTDAVILSNITADLPSTDIPRKVTRKFNNLVLADPQYDTSSPIDFLIAADLFPFLYDGQRITSGTGFPSALHSIFGWVITGEINFDFSSTSSSLPSIGSHLSTTTMPMSQYYPNVTFE